MIGAMPGRKDFEPCRRMRYIACVWRFMAIPRSVAHTAPLIPATDMINTLATLLVFQTIGEGLAYAFSLPVPGPVIGMVLLFIYFLLKKGAAEKLAPVSLELLKHLSLLFIPAGVGVMVHAQRVAAEWLPIAAALLASTIVSIAVTAVVVKWLQK